MVGRLLLVIRGLMMLLIPCTGTLVGWLRRALLLGLRLCQHSIESSFSNHSSWFLQMLLSIRGFMRRKTAVHPDIRFRRFLARIQGLVTMSSWRVGNPRHSNQIPTQPSRKISQGLPIRFYICRSMRLANFGTSLDVTELVGSMTLLFINEGFCFKIIGIYQDQEHPDWYMIETDVLACSRQTWIFSTNG